jgi:hypothetical protein
VIAGLSDDYAAPGLVPADAVAVPDTPVVDGGSSAEAAPVDAPSPDAGITGCADAGYIFCDDFEEGTLGKWVTLDGASVDSTFACSGSKSLHMQQHVNNPTGQIYELVISHSGQLPDHAFVRTFVRFAVTPNPDVAFLQLYETSTTRGVQEEVNAGTFGGQNYNFSPHLTWGGVPARIGQCDCVEIEVTHQDAGIGVSVNGQRVSNAPFPTLPKFDQLVLGFSSNPTQSTSYDEEAWYDDVAYDDKPIGCTR